MKLNNGGELVERGLGLAGDVVGPSHVISFR